VFYRLLLIIFLILNINLAFAQNGNISGFVFDDSNGESLSGANIYFEDLTIGSVSNTSGYYVLSEIPAGDYTLICSYIGFKDFRDNISMSADQSIRLNIQLEPALLETETVVVTADSERTALQLYRKDISKINISPMEIKNLPAVAEADLLRTLQSLPGILPISDYSSEIFVRRICILSTVLMSIIPNMHSDYFPHLILMPLKILRSQRADLALNMGVGCHLY